MTEDERAAGRWQGEITARIADVERRTAVNEGKLDDREKIITDLTNKITHLAARQQVMWSAIASAMALIAGGAFKLWTGG